MCCPRGVINDDDSHSFLRTYLRFGFVFVETASDISDGRAVGAGAVRVGREPATGA